MTRMLIKPFDLLAAAAPASASFALSQVNEIAAALAAVLGVIYLGIGIALRWRKLRRDD
jgi:hypothetical protein